MKMKFEVIYEQVIREKDMFVVEAESEEALEKCFDYVERRANSGFIDSFHGVFQAMDRNKDISVLEYGEEHEVEANAPKYYDHWEVHDENELEEENK